VAKKQVENGAQVGRANLFVLDEIFVTHAEYISMVPIPGNQRALFDGPQTVSRVSVQSSSWIRIRLRIADPDPPSKCAPRYGSRWQIFLQKFLTTHVYRNKAVFSP
jgi:hypothetical protein